MYIYCAYPAILKIQNRVRFGKSMCQNKPLSRYITFLRSAHMLHKSTFRAFRPTQFITLYFVMCYHSILSWQQEYITILHFFFYLYLFDIEIGIPHTHTQGIMGYRKIKYEQHMYM